MGPINQGEDDGEDFASETVEGCGGERGCCHRSRSRDHLATVGSGVQFGDLGARPRSRAKQALSGNHAQATVSFGQWDVNPNPAPPSKGPFDRQPTNSDRFRNVHELLPFEVTIDEGGAVTFIISGVHQIVVYTGDTQLSDLQAAAKNPANHLPGVPPLLEHPQGRQYRGLDPRALFYLTPDPANAASMIPLLVQDRIEGVNFAHAGRYLVVCGVVPHLLEGMHGYVNVREKKPE